MNPICKTHPNGTKQWWFNGKLHREDGPAIEYSNGGKCWCINGELHRLDGPAIEYSNGDRQWWINNKQYSFEEWDRLRKLPWLL